MGGIQDRESENTERVPNLRKDLLWALELIALLEMLGNVPSPKAGSETKECGLGSV